MKKMKKFFAMFLALAMVLGMSVTTFAADTSTSLGEGVQPASGQEGIVTISGGAIKKDKGITFEAYQLIEAKFVDKVGFDGYVWSDTFHPEDVEPGDKIVMEEDKKNVVGLTSENINAWAVNASGATPITPTWSTNGGTDVASIKLTAGTWMIIPKSSDASLIFNPMVASVYYQQKDSDNTINGGDVNAGGNWTLNGTAVYQKSTDITSKDDKKVGTSTTVDGKVVFTEAEANAQVGESRAFQLTGLIPSYGPEYFATVDGIERTVTYTLKDYAANGLKYNNDIVVYVGKNPVTPGDDTYKVTWYSDEHFITTTTDVATAKAFKIEFESEYIKGLAGLADTARSVEVIYSAEITSAAVSAVGQNQYTVDYTRQPGEDTSTTTKTVYTYTAAINGAIKKVDEAGTPLANAVFELTYVEDGETKTIKGVATEVEKDGDTFKASSGNIKFEGLKFDREYTLKETQAPDGYSINNTEYTVVCKYPDDFNEKGTEQLTEYTVVVTNKTTNVVTTIEHVPYGGSANVLGGAATFVNTTLTSLPSTGGIGTTIFTIGGCAIMILAAALYFATRRKSAR